MKVTIITLIYINYITSLFLFCLFLFFYIYFLDLFFTFFSERALFASLQFPPSLHWLQLIYQNKIEQYNHTSTINEQYNELVSYGFYENLELRVGLAENAYYRNDFNYCIKLCKE
jgi:hypothetical protein